MTGYDAGMAGVTGLLIVCCWLFAVFAPYIINANMAKKKNKDVGIWILLTVLFGWFATLFLAISQSDKSVEEKELDLELKKAQLDKMNKRK